MDITHADIGYLKVQLTPPEGPRKTLYDRTDGGADIDQTYAPDVGSDIEIKGEWTLRILNYAYSYTGTLNSWTLTIDYTDGSTTTTTTNLVNRLRASNSAHATRTDTRLWTPVSTSLGYLKVQLTPPEGPRKTLYDRTDGGADIDQTYAPDVGSDIEIKGEWTLRILNYAYSYTGTLNSWTLTIDYTDGSTTTTTTNLVTSVTGSGSQYLVTVASEQEGTYNLDVSQDNNIVDSSSNSLSSLTPTGDDQPYTVTFQTIPPPADTTDPVITLAGSSSVSVELGTTYTDAGATCSDDTDGDISSQIVTSNPVDTNVAQTYTVEYTCTDSSGQSASPVTRTVIVLDSVRSVGTVTLTSNTTGTIHVEWNESIETPMEYRVAWTKIDDGFKSLGDHDWNAYPTDSEYTITDLEEGEESQSQSARKV